MIRDLISNRREDYSFYISCDCSMEIVQFYYYKGTTTCPEIIGVRFYGNFYSGSGNNVGKPYCRKRCNKKRAPMGDVFSFTFSYEDFCKLVDGVNDKNNKGEEELLGLDLPIVSEYATFGMKHEVGSYISISKSNNKGDYYKGNYLWDITFHKSLFGGVVDRLNEMKLVIDTNY